MIDPELKYCPQCEDEYRAEIDTCATCEIPLITGSEKLSMEEARKQRLTTRQGELTQEDDIVTIHGGQINDIKHIEGLLAAERIGTLVVGDDKSCDKGCCPSNYYLQVRREDAMDALEIIKAEHHRATGLVGHHDENGHADSVYDSSAGQATCPACGHTFPTSTTTCPDCGLCFG